MDAPSDTFIPIIRIVERAKVLVAQRWLSWAGAQRRIKIWFISWFGGVIWSWVLF